MVDINNDNVFVVECIGSDFWLNLNPIGILTSPVQLLILVPKNDDGGTWSEESMIADLYGSWT